MRTYTVKVGDSPAKIATEFAGCPLCSRDLIEANGTKPVVRYPNGFVTFRTLAVGEVLNLPDKWFSGYLDTLPQSYFDGLPQMPTRAPISEGTKSSLAGHGVGQNVSPANVVQSCVAWALGGSILVGQTAFPAINPNVPPAAFAQAASFMPTEPYVMEIAGRPYLFKPVTGPQIATHAVSPTVQIYYCTRQLPHARPSYMNVRPPSGYSGGSRFAPGARGGEYVGVGANPPPPPPPPPKPGIPAPPNNVGTPPPNVSFLPEDRYTMTVWPLPQGTLIHPDPASILADIGFDVVSDVPNADGSHAIAAVYTGPSPYVPIDGSNTLVVTAVASPGQPMGARIFQAGDILVSANPVSYAAVLASEYDAPNSYDAVLTVQNVSGSLPVGAPLQGNSGGAARLKFQYRKLLQSQSGQLGLMDVTNLGTNLKLPYDVQPGDQCSMTVRPTTNQNSDMSDPVAILVALGFAGSDLVVGTQNADCTWPIQTKSSSASPITIKDLIMDPSTAATAWVTSLTVNGNIILPKSPPPPPAAAPTMRACHAFTLTFLQTQCTPLTGGPFDPTDGLAAMGLTKFTLSPVSGPDAQGQWSVNGVWELGDGFVLPASKKITITQFQDDGPSVNVAGGPCGSGLPFTIQPGDSINAIVRPMAVPGQPMTNPVALLTTLGFQNVSSASPYSDCTWLVTADWPGPQPLQITDPMISPSAGGMWIVGFSVNGTTVKDANWLALQEQPIDLVQCGSYSVLFTYDTCPALGGAPGSWDPTAAITALLPGFKLAPGPNEFGEWTATGTWNSPDTTLQGSGGVHFTMIVDYGPAPGCTPPAPPPKLNPNPMPTLPQPPPAAGCAAGTIADTVTGACVTPCSDGSAPANGVCGGTKAGATPPVTPPATAAGVTTGEVVAGVTVVALLGGAAYFFWL